MAVTHLRTIGVAFEANMKAYGLSMRAFYALWLIGSHVLLPIIAVVSWSMHARPAAMINVCIVWILAGIVTCLLFHANWALPQNSLVNACAIQAALIFALIPACSAAYACLMYEVRARMQVMADARARAHKNLFIRQITVIVIPYAVSICFAVPGVITAVNQLHHLPYDDPAGISLRRRFYCTVEHGPFTMSAGIATAGFLIPTLVFKVQIILTLWKNWKVLRSTAAGAAELRFAGRMLCLCSYLAVAAGLSIAAAFLPMNIIPDMFLATCASCAAIFFATAREFWRTLQGLFFWRRAPIEEPVAEQPRLCCEPPSPV